MRNDSVEAYPTATSTSVPRNTMIIRHKCFREALPTSLLALSMVIGAHAQGTTSVSRAAATQGKKSPAAPPKPGLEPKAIDLLKVGSEHLASAHTLSFRAEEIFEQPSRQG